MACYGVALTPAPLPLGEGSYHLRSGLLSRPPRPRPRPPRPPVPRGPRGPPGLARLRFHVLCDHHADGILPGGDVAEADPRRLAAIVVIFEVARLLRAGVKRLVLVGFAKGKLRLVMFGFQARAKSSAAPSWTGGRPSRWSAKRGSTPSEVSWFLPRPRRRRRRPRRSSFSGAGDSVAVAAASPANSSSKSSDVSSITSRASCGSKDRGSVAVGSSSSQAVNSASISAAITFGGNVSSRSWTGAGRDGILASVARETGGSAAAVSGGTSIPKSPASWPQAAGCAGRRSWRTGLAAGLKTGGGGAAAGCRLSPDNSPAAAGANCGFSGGGAAPKSPASAAQWSFEFCSVIL